ncbi:toxin-antitoxin system YwqK family antitoxin [Pedobacter soli]|uniref:TonB C-terminal domain-containing protein n=1 Tax=Pedobacter soli TaxID=390242 RepID=A0A1G6SUD3_9SPHI|nr:hypothetical protein [Pedobacter soli]SDD20388.1 hypothetical protein SAMN04488024_104365 [Pedobacter soli]
MSNRFLLLFVLFPALLMAQSRIVQLPPFGDTLDSIRNNSRTVVEKLASNSAWIVHQYDAQDSIMTIGTFKDEKLTIPSGRFKYYHYSPPHLQITYDYATHKTDSVIVPAKNFLHMVGYFVDGERTGIWTTFNDSNEKKIAQTYEHGKLNGLYESYNHGILSVTGNYVDDMREGEWYILSGEGDTIQTDIYKKNKLIKAIPSINKKKDKYKQVTDPRPKYDFVRYLNTQLSKKGMSQSGTKNSFYSITIDKTGRVTEPSVITRKIIDEDINFAVDTAIIDAMLSAPLWIPGEQDKQKIAVGIRVHLDIEFNKKSIRVSLVNPSTN